MPTCLISACYLFLAASLGGRNILHVHLPPEGRHCQPLHLPLSTHRQSRRKVLTNQEYWQHLNAPLPRQLQVKKSLRRIPKRKKRCLKPINEELPKEEQKQWPGLFVFVGYVSVLSKPRRRRQRERHQTKGLMSKTIAVHVRYNSLYISMASSA